MLWNKEINFHCFDFKFETINGQLCVFAYQGKESFLYLPPLGGESDKITIKACFEYMGKSRIARVENISANQLALLKPDGYNGYLKAYEYLYRRIDLEKLAGNKYKSKRHDVNLFQKNYPQVQFRQFKSSDLNACRDLYQRWSKNRLAHCDDPVYTLMLAENSGVHALLMKHADDLGLIGRVLDIDGEIAGYTFGFILDEKTFCVNLEVTDLDKTGSAAYIFNCFCKDPALNRFELINTMDDFGMPNVADFKTG